MLDFDTIKTYYNRCNPEKPLHPDDPYNVDIDKEPGKVRGMSWAEKLAKKIAFADSPVCLLFSGLPGSGKSTELLRLKTLLSEQDFFPVLINAEDLLDLNNPVDLPDILSVLVYATERTILEATGRDPETALQESYFNRFWHWLTTTEVELTKAEANIGQFGKFVVEMKTQPAFRKKVSKAICANLSHYLKEVRDALILYQDQAKRLRPKGLVILFDSLEKLQGLTSNWEKVLDSAERVFGGGAPNLRLPVHVLYTVPPALMAKVLVEDEFIPMIKVRNRAGDRWPDGIAAARELLRRRIPDAAMVEILGPDFEDRLAELIAWTGGHPRQLLQLFRKLLLADAFPVSEAEYARTLNGLRDEYRLVIPADAFDWLARVAREKFLTAETDEHRRMADRMLKNSVILRYENDDRWFDLHPSVYHIPGVEEALRNPDTCACDDASGT